MRRNDVQFQHLSPVPNTSFRKAVFNGLINLQFHLAAQFIHSNHEHSRPNSHHKKTAESTVFSILLSISFSHLLNDTIQSLVPSIYPVVKDSMQLSFSQIGFITLVFQLCVHRFFNHWLERLQTGGRNLIRWRLACPLHLPDLWFVAGKQLRDIAAFCCNDRHRIFDLHPEVSKVAYMAAGNKRGLAQSIFQVGGNTGSSLGPLLAALIIVPLRAVEHSLVFIARISCYCCADNNR